LKELVIDEYGARGEIIAMPSTVDKIVFRPMDQTACRRSLGLPPGAKLIGTAGGLYRDKGVGALYEAWKVIAQQRPDVHLILAGPVEPGFPPPGGERVHTLGMLPHARTAELFNALDVGVIYLRDTPFGRYCFPQKAYEMLACELPIAAARIGVMPQLLASTPVGLYAPDDPADLARAVLELLDRPVVATVPIDDWAHIVGGMEERLRLIVGDA
jgi:glycosyltransferase involved in cell wall biosynthesis